MTADEAARSWFTRSAEVITDYKGNGPSMRTWSESQLAANGMSLLLQNRWDELSDASREHLQRGVDVMADVTSKSLGAAQGSPLADATEEFYNAVRGEVIVGAKRVADYIPDPNEFKIGLLLVVVLALFLLSRRV